VQPIDIHALEAALQAFVGQVVYLHLETTNGAYSEANYNAFIRNGKILIRRAQVKGEGPFRVGLMIEDGWVYAAGLTDWEVDPQGRLLMAGHDKEGRLTVALELSRTPFDL
jgi:hypothetical protein